MRTVFRALAVLLLTLPAVASTQDKPDGYQAPQHTSRNSPLFLVPDEATLRMRADAGMQIEQSRSPADDLAEHRKLPARSPLCSRSGPGRSMPM